MARSGLSKCSNGRFVCAALLALSATLASAQAQPVAINTATVDELDELPYVGPATAEAIIAARPYSTCADLQRAKGIGPATETRICPLVTFGDSAAPATPVTITLESGLVAAVECDATSCHVAITGRELTEADIEIVGAGR